MAHEFDNILNFRDVGKTVNDFLGRRYEEEEASLGDIHRRPLC